MSFALGHWLWALGYDPTLTSLDRQQKASTSTVTLTPGPSEPSEPLELSEPTYETPDISRRDAKRPLAYCSRPATPDEPQPSPYLAQPPSPVSSLTDTLCEIMEPLSLVPVQGVPHSAEEKPTASHVEVAAVPPSSPPAIEATGTKRRFSLSPPSRTSSPANANVYTAPALASPSIHEGNDEQKATTLSTTAATTETTTTTTNVPSDGVLDQTTAALTAVTIQESQTSASSEPQIESQIPATPPVPSASSAVVANPLDAVKTAQPPQTFTMRQVAQHNSPRDLWLVIGDEVFDCTEFAATHPGGAKILNGVAGKDATKKFDKYHRRAILERYKPKLQVGFLDNDLADSGKARKGFLGKLGFGGKGKPKGPYGLDRRGTM